MENKKLGSKSAYKAKGNKGTNFKSILEYKQGNSQEIDGGKKSTKTNKSGKYANVKSKVYDFMSQKP